jgi:3-hydroxyisobutyrate dehydrogenase
MTLVPQNVAWIGAGVMGAPMAGHLLRAGVSMVVHSRTQGKAEELLEAGARWADSPAEAADGADVVVTMLGFPSEVEEVHLGAAGTLAAARPPQLLIDMSTSQPSLARRIYKEAAKRGIGSVDAPVSGGDVGARQAKLAIMVGAEVADFERAKPLLDILGPSVVLQGGPGAGQHTKMVNQILIASNMVGVCEGLLYAVNAGLDPQRVIESVGSGAAGSWSINNLGPRMIQGDLAPGFYVEHFIKDLEIALEEASRMGLQLPGLSLALNLYENVRELGNSRSGTQALRLALERLNSEAKPITSDETSRTACPEPTGG